MAYEYPSAAGTLQLLHVRGHWLLQFAGRRHGAWRSPDAAAKAIAEHQSGLTEWDRDLSDAPADLLDWRPIGEAL